MNRRGRARPPRSSRPPSTHIATRPGEVWCWDMTFLPAQVQGRWFYLYLILDLFSRKIVGFEVHETDSADHAAHLARVSAWSVRSFSVFDWVFATPAILLGSNPNGGLPEMLCVLPRHLTAGAPFAFSDRSTLLEAPAMATRWRPGSCARAATHRCG